MARLVPEAEFRYLQKTGRHTYACLEGDVIGQVHVEWDMPLNSVYLTRKCSVCGVPFVDGSLVCNAIEGLNTYIAESESGEESLDHLHVKGLNDPKREDVLYVQPNHFLRGYSSDGVSIETYDKKELDLLSQNGGVDPFWLGVAGYRDETEGSTLLKRIYEKYYDVRTPIPVMLPEIIFLEKGDRFYEEFSSAMKSANKIGIATKASMKIVDFNKRINEAIRERKIERLMKKH
jgi:hypothetical protein